MEEVDPETALTAVDSERERRRERAVDALEWFRDRAGLVPRSEAVPALAAAHDWSEAQANVAVGDVVGDLVDPVQQVVHPERGKLVGIIEYSEYPDSGAYGYTDYDDVAGERKRVVCSRCVTKAETDAEVTHATEGEGTAPENASWTELVTAVEDHYNEHDVEPSKVEVGASLASGTTISGNTAFHKGNDGVGSGLDADTLDGRPPDDIGGGNVVPLATADGFVTGGVQGGGGNFTLASTALLADGNANKDTAITFSPSFSGYLIAAVARSDDGRAVVKLTAGGPGGNEIFDLKRSDFGEYKTPQTLISQTYVSFSGNTSLELQVSADASGNFFASGAAGFGTLRRVNTPSQYEYGGIYTSGTAGHRLTKTITPLSETMLLTPNAYGQDNYTEVRLYGPDGTVAPGTSYPAFVTGLDTNTQYSLVKVPDFSGITSSFTGSNAGLARIVGNSGTSPS